jgi:trimeric autotransporter adhesin
MKCDFSHIRAFARPSNRWLESLALVLAVAAFGGWELTRNVARVHAQAQPPRLYVSTARQFATTYRGSASARHTMAGHPSALAMAAGNLDGDAITDLAVGFAAPGGGGVIALHHGNLDAFAPQSEASFWAITRGDFPSPFLPGADLVEIPGRPDFLAAGDFVGQGGGALATATLGGNSIYVLAKGASGNLELQQTITTPGAITGLDAHQLFAGKYGQVAVGVHTANGASLVIYTGSHEGLTQTASFPLAGDATSFASGNLDGDGIPDLLVIAGGQPTILHGGTQTLEAVKAPYTVASAAVGRFVPDRDPLAQIALLATDGSLHILAQSTLDPTPWTVAEVRAKRQAQIAQMQQHIHVPPAPQRAVTWKEVESYPGMGAPDNTGRTPLMFRTRISSHAEDDLMLLSSARVAVLAHPTSQVSQGQEIDRTDLGVDATAALMVRVNIDGRPGVVYMQRGQSVPRVLMPLPDPTFTVNTINDTVDANPGDGVCADSTGHCSLRAAVMEANALAGTDTISIPAGTYTLTIPRASNPPEDASSGTLDVTDSVNIVGAGQNTTIIQAGTRGVNDPGGPNGVDKVFSFNQDINILSNATVSVSSLTIQNGYNRGNFTIADGWGGAFDCDTGTSGNASVSLTNVTLNNNTVTQGEGGGFAMFNFLVPTGTGQVTATNSIIENNAVPNNGMTSDGGGVWMGQSGRLTISNTQVTGNKVPGSGQGGGGILSEGVGAKLILHNVSVSNNSATGDGGGILTLGAVTIDQNSIISNNTTGGNGGGLAFEPDQNQSVSLSAVTITGNTASPGGFGGGVYINDSSSAADSFSMQYSRLWGNSAPASLYFDGPTTQTITATENWWGSNSDPKTGPNPTIVLGTSNSGPGVVTYSPWIVLTFSPASATTVPINQTLGLSADLAHDSNGATAALSGHLGVFNGLPITFAAGSGGSISPTQPVTLDSSAAATSTFQAGGSAANSSASVTFDGFTLSTNITIVQPPSMTKMFNPTTVTPNTSSLVTFGVTNGNTVAIDANFTDSLPSGLKVVSVASNGCGGTLTATAGATSIGFTNSSLAVGSCTIGVNVAAAVDGVYTNSTTINSTAAGNGNTPSATLTVITPPSISKNFGAATVVLNGTTSLTFTLSNPNVNSTLNGLGFTDTFPSGLVVAAGTPTNTCGGSLSASGGTVSLSAVTLGPGANCTVGVTVQVTALATLTNIVQPTSTNGGTGSVASASLAVVGPPTLSKSFGASSIAVGGSTTLSFALQNNNTGTTLHNVGFSDTLPAGLAIATPNGLTGSCGGGTITATAGTGVVSLSGAALNAGGGSCAFSVNVTGTAAGVDTNTTGAPTSTEGGSGTPASASITVVGPPSITKSFGSGTISLNASTPLTFTLGNSNTTVSLTGVAFTDVLPTGLTVSSATGTTCGGTLAVTAPVTIQLANAVIAANSQCQFSVTVTGASPGNYTNTTGNVTSANGGTGSTATASLTVSSPATVTNISSTAANGSYSAGASIPITVTFSKAVNVTGTPLLALNSGGTASYSSGSGTATLTFAYTVLAGQNSAHLDATSSTALSLNGGTILDSTSTPANLTLPAPGAAGSLGANKSIVIDTTAPTVVSYSVLFGAESYNVIGSSRVRLPWEISGIRVVFSKPIASGDINSLSGASVTGFSGLGTNTLNWAISPVAIGNLATMLAGSGADAIKDAAGNALAGGSGFSQNLKILWGDFNDDGVVNAGDGVAVNSVRVSNTYNIFADMNGDGVVNVTDVEIVRTRIGTSLP